MDTASPTPKIPNDQVSEKHIDFREGRRGIPSGENKLSPEQLQDIPSEKLTVAPIEKKEVLTDGVDIEKVKVLESEEVVPSLEAPALPQIEAVTVATEPAIADVSPAIEVASNASPPADLKGFEKWYGDLWVTNAEKPSTEPVVESQSKTE